jgi:hypothetical protein
MEIKVNVPQSWDDVTLSDYLAFYRDIPDATEDHIQNKALEHFCKIPAPDVRTMNHHDRAALCNELTTMLTSKPEHRLSFTLNGVEYGFHPELAQMTFGEFLDLEATLDDIQKMGTQMSILYRRITRKKGDRYTIEAYNPKDFKDLSAMPAGVALGAQVFFWTLGSGLYSYTLRSLTGVKGRRKKRYLDESGDGLRRLTTSLEATLAATIQSPRFLPLNVLSSLLSTPTVPLLKPKE